MGGGGGGAGGGNLGIMGAGGLREAEEEGAGGETSERGEDREKWKNSATLAQYFAIGKTHRGGNRFGRGRDPGVQGTGGGRIRPPYPTPSPACLESHSTNPSGKSAEGQSRLKYEA